MQQVGSTTTANGPDCLTAAVGALAGLFKGEQVASGNDFQVRVLLSDLHCCNVRRECVVTVAVKPNGVNRLGAMTAQLVQWIQYIVTSLQTYVGNFKVFAQS